MRGRPANLYHLPAITPYALTTANALCGAIGILLLSAMSPDFMRITPTFDIICAFIMFGVLFDFLDGAVAHLLHVTTTFGTTLDAFADFLTFGVLAASTFYSWQVRRTAYPGSLYIYIELTSGILYILCGLWRLARLSTSTEAALNRAVFYGLPIVVPAMTVVGIVRANFQISHHLAFQMTYSVLIVLEAFAMLSEWRYPRLSFPMPYRLAIVPLLSVASLLLPSLLLLACTIYFLLGPSAVHFIEAKLPSKAAEVP